MIYLTVCVSIIINVIIHMTLMSGIKNTRFWEGYGYLCPIPFAWIFLIKSYLADNELSIRWRTDEDID